MTLMKEMLPSKEAFFHVVDLWLNFTPRMAEKFCHMWRTKIGENQLSNNQVENKPLLAPWQSPSRNGLSPSYRPPDQRVEAAEDEDERTDVPAGRLPPRRIEGRNTKTRQQCLRVSAIQHSRRSPLLMSQECNVTTNLPSSRNPHSFTQNDGGNSAKCVTGQCGLEQRPPFHCSSSASPSSSSPSWPSSGSQVNHETDGRGGRTPCSCSRSRTAEC